MADDAKNTWGPFRLDWTITIPDLIALLTAVGAIVYSFAGVRQDIAVQQEQIKVHEKRITELQEADRETTKLLREMNTKLDTLIGQILARDRRDK